MSYRNPQIFFADSTALQKGFDAGFSSMQGKFEKERLEKERIAKEQEDALKEAYNSSDLSDIANLDTRIMAGLQSAVDSIIEKGQFATASASEQAKMLRQVSAVKNTIQRLGDLAAMPQENWDIRNSAKISALKTALTKGDKSINIVGDGLDLKIVGDFGEVTLDELSAAKFMDKTGFDDEYQDLTTKFIKNAEARYAVAASKGVELDREDFKTMFFNIIKKEGDPELWSYLYSNQMDSKKMEGRFYGDPETKKVVGEDYEDRQFNTMIDDLFDTVIGSAYDSKALLEVGIEDREMKKQRANNSQGLNVREKKYYNDDLKDFRRFSNTLKGLESGELGWINDVAEMAKNPDFYKETDSDFINNMASIGFTHDKTGWTEGSEVNEYKFKHVTGATITLSPRADNVNSTANSLLKWARLAVKSYEGVYDNDPNFMYNSTGGGVTASSGNIYK